MKCAACGHEKRKDSYLVDKVKYYKSGKRKGEVKNITREYLYPDKDIEDFVPISLSEDLRFYSTPIDDEREEVFLCACPKCGTVKVDKICW